MNRLLAFVVFVCCFDCFADVTFNSISGSRERITVSDNSALDAAYPSSISFWVRIDTYSASADGSIITKFFGSTDSERMGFRTDGSNFYITEAGSNRISLASWVTSGSWHHVSLTLDGSKNATAYVDGVSRGTSTFTGVWFNNSGDLIFGACLAGTSFYGSEVEPFDGALQDVRIYNRELSSSEIETLYKSRIGEGNPVSSGLVGYWPLNDNSGNLSSATFVDRSGNGNSGTGSDASAIGGQCSRETFLTSP